MQKKEARKRSSLKKVIKCDVKNYTILYVVKNDVIEVRRIIYSRRNLKDMI